MLTRRLGLAKGGPAGPLLVATVVEGLVVADRVDGPAAVETVVMRGCDRGGVGDEPAASLHAREYTLT